ncbi:orc1/cdc6 family replication initiation protein [Salinigranum salinum]|uniref:orc1/cdc6 family replication initiation protein n=1 Tax=Salinigranum salinum TaxID=1364937 RepID=UPI0012607B12|nr:orc1/cdc6 family replication initiation protein [Salinigranum salinum]
MEHDGHSSDPTGGEPEDIPDAQEPDSQTTQETLADSDDSVSDPDPNSASDNDTTGNELSSNGGAVSSTTSSEGQISIRERLQSQSTSSVFAEKDLVRPETIIDEDRIVGRDDQLERVIDNLRPALQGAGLPNMLLNGPSGTGKSLIINSVCKQIVDLCEGQDQRFGVISLNCERPSSLDQAVYRLVKSVADDVGVEVGVPQTGVSTDLKFERLFDMINEYYDSVIFILDEIDLLVGPYDDNAFSSLLYQLSRAETLGNIEGSVSVTALTNYTHFLEDLSSRAESSFNPDDIFFDDYDANQLQAILRNRRDAFKEGALESDVIPLVAAFGSQTHGDARKAIDLFRWSGEIAERNGDDVVTEEHVRTAQEKYDENRTLRHVNGLATQKKLALYATAAVQHFAKNPPGKVPAGVGYNVYRFIAESIGADHYSRETYVNKVTEQKTYGVLDYERRGRGRGRGVHMFFSLDEDPEDLLNTIAEDSRIGDIDENMLRSVVNAQLSDFD